MKKEIATVVGAAFLLGGCATTQSLTPCEKAVLAVYAAQKILSQVCPLSQPAPESVEGVY